MRNETGKGSLMKALLAVTALAAFVFVVVPTAEAASCYERCAAGCKHRWPYGGGGYDKCNNTCVSLKCSGAK